jgi:hypothetical protein
LRLGKFLEGSLQGIKAKILGIVGKSTVQWSSDAIRGLEKMLQVKGETYYEAVLKGYGDAAVKNASEGIARGVVDISKVDPDKVVKYASGSMLNSFSSESGVYEIKYMFNAKSGIVTKSGEKTIDGLIVFTEGVEETWGYKHFFEYVRPGDPLTRAQQLQSHFGLANDRGAVLELLQEVAEKGTKNIAEPNVIEYSKIAVNGKQRIIKISTGIDSDKIGKIITAIDPEV